MMRRGDLQPTRALWMLTGMAIVAILTTLRRGRARGRARQDGLYGTDMRNLITLRALRRLAAVSPRR